MQNGRGDVADATQTDPPREEWSTGLTPLATPGPGAVGHTPTWKRRRVMLVGWDAAGWALALTLSAALRYEFTFSDIPWESLDAVVLVAIVAQLAVGALLQTYRGRHCVGSSDDAINVTGAVALTGTLLFLVDFFVQPQLVLRSIPLLAVPIAVVFAVGSRLAVRRYREHRYRPDTLRAQRVIIYGAGPEGHQLLRLMLSDADGGLLPVALLDDNQVFRRRRISGVAVHGTRADIAAAAARTRADLLVIADRTLPADTMREVASAARAAGLTVSVVPALSELLQPLPGGLTVPAPRPPAGTRVSEVVDRPSSSVFAPAPAPALAGRSWSKRLFDIGVGLVAGLVTLPMLLGIAIVLKIGDGQVIYRAPRIGRDGKPFTMFKFATMVPGDSGPRVSRQRDPRITPLGGWLRATKLNELPQILNVIKGDMSLVGPRPEDPRYTAHFSARQREVLAVRPGMTSLAFLEFGDEQAFIERARPEDVEAFYLRTLLPEKLDIELSYVHNWSMREDLRILARTVRALLT